MSRISLLSEDGGGILTAQGSFVYLLLRRHTTTTRFWARFKCCVFLIAAAHWLILSGRANAVTTSWNTNSSGVFTTAANWDNGEPVLGDTAVFNRGAGVAYTVTFPGGSILDPPPIYVIDYLRVHSNDVTFRDNSSPFITSPGFAVANPDVSIVIGQDAGEVAILNTSLRSLSGANTWIGRGGRRWHAQCQRGDVQYE